MLPPGDLAQLLIFCCLAPIRWIETWARECGRDLVRMFHAGPPSTRGFHRNFAIGQSHVHRAARGIIWDLRRQREGIIVPLDFAASAASVLDLTAFADALATYPDQEATGFLFDGTQFKADLSLEIVLLPHLLDLSKGTARVDAELRRLIDLVRYEICSALHFVPCRSVPNGTVERKLEPDRPRRKEDQGQPRSPLAIRGGLCF